MGAGGEASGKFFWIPDKKNASPRKFSAGFDPRSRILASEASSLEGGPGAKPPGKFFEFPTRKMLPR